MPDVGGANAVGLTPLHPCCLRTDTVALPEALRGVPSCLVSLVPAMMRPGGKCLDFTVSPPEALQPHPAC